MVNFLNSPERPKWNSPIGLFPFHRAQKTQEFQGPTPFDLDQDTALLYVSGSGSDADLCIIMQKKIGKHRSLEYCFCDFFMPFNL